MKKLAAPFLLTALLAPAAMAAPWLECDVYPTGKPQPTEFVISVSGSSTPIVSSAVSSGSGGVYLHADVGSWTAGAKTVTVKARNAAGESAASAPFSFTVQPPVTPLAAPTGIGLSAD
jgi:hypothetical protein